MFEEIEKIKETVSAIKVIPLDMVKLNSDIDKHLKKGRALGENEFYTVYGQYGLIKDTNMFTDTECVAELVENVETDKITFEVYVQTVIDGKTKSWDIIPIGTTGMPLGELIKDYGLSEVNLPTFMGEQFAKNRRVKSNIGEILKEYKKQTKTQSV